MTGYVIAHYRITNPANYAAYVPAVVGTLQAHSAEILVADYASEPLEGAPSAVTVVLKFESKAAARAWYDSSEYREIVHLRTDSSEGFMVLVDGFVMP